MRDESMRGLFFIVKGHYRRGAEPHFKNEVSGDNTYIGGYDPFSPQTDRWYMLMDRRTYHCIACGGDLEKVLGGVYNVIMKHKGKAENYFKRVSDTTSDDYYEVYYLGHTPLNHEQRVKKAEGRCPRVSPTMRELYGKVYDEYGDYFRSEVEEMENKAYNDLKGVSVCNTKGKVKKPLFKTTSKGVDVTPPSVEETPKVLKKMIKPKLGLKKI